LGENQRATRADSIELTTSDSRLRSEDLGSLQNERRAGGGIDLANGENAEQPANREAVELRLLHSAMTARAEPGSKAGERHSSPGAAPFAAWSALIGIVARVLVLAQRLVARGWGRGVCWWWGERGVAPQIRNRRDDERHFLSRGLEVSGRCRGGPVRTEVRASAGAAPSAPGYRCFVQV
jgi:hypothetical protein